MLGAHQGHNAAVALASLDALAERGFEVGPDDVARGFAGLCWPARVEVLAESPWVVVDGAHNVASAAALAETLRTSFPPLPLDARLRHDAREGLARPVAGPPAAGRIGRGNPLRRKSPVGPAGGDRRGRPRP